MCSYNNLEPMTSIFYDLETTSQDPIGQILNYCFLLVDDSLKPIDECSGLISISPLELPRVGAILANRVDVLDHQRVARESERQAMCRIASFIEAATKKARGKLPLIGYNSSRFDLPYLRTSFIRSGVLPYFYGKLSYRDLLFASRKLSCTDRQFPRKPHEGGDSKKLSLKLETLTKAFGLLRGPQLHESRADVELTIALAQYLRDHYSLDVRSYEPYEAISLAAQHQEDESLIVAQLLPQYDLTSNDLCVQKSLCLLERDRSGKSALWIDLDHFSELESGDPEELRRSVRWLRTEHSQYIVGDDLSSDKSLQEKAEHAKHLLSGVKLSNFFRRPTCDIEQHIFRIHENNNFKPLEALCSSIEHNDRTELEQNGSKDAKVLFTRYRLRHAGRNNRESDTFEDLAKSYYRYRYGGDLQLSRSSDSPGSHHPTLQELYAELQEAGSGSQNPQDKRLISALQQFYDASEPARLCPELRN